MRGTNDKPMKVEIDDLRELKKISAERFLKGMDKQQLPPKRILKAMLRVPNIKDILTKTKFRDGI